VLSTERTEKIIQNWKKTAFWCTFHLFVVFTGHNTVTFINNMQNKNYFRSYWSYKVWTKFVINIHRISSLDEQVWIQTFHNKSLFQFITILSNSRQNISYTIIFTFNMFHNRK
jgi:hypothetical protein